MLGYSQNVLLKTVKVRTHAGVKSLSDAILSSKLPIFSNCRYQPQRLLLTARLCKYYFS